MSKRNIADEWKLEGANQPEQQWVLQEAEQKSLGPWQLQDQPQVAIEWQPVDYVRDRRGGGANWILPTFVGVALVAALAYAGWVVLNRTGILTATPLPQETPVATEAAGTTNTEPTPTAAQPTATPPPPTPTSPPPSPTPTLAPPTPTTIPIVELASALITADNGVNARQEPSLTGAVIRVVNKDEKFLIASEQPDWVQVALAPGQLAWVTAEYVQKSVERVELGSANQRRADAGLPPLSAATALTGTTPLSPTAQLTATAPITAPANLTTTPVVTGSTGSTTTASTPTLEATIAITSGLNARSSPNLAANNVIRLLANGETHPAVARSPDGQWVQLRLTEDGRLAWVAAEYVELNGDLNSLPAAQPTTAGPVATAGGATATAPITATQSVTTATGATNGVTATVNQLAGANARATPDLNTTPLLTLPFDSVLTVLGRSADSTWVKVTLEGSESGWVLASEVKLTADLASLAVVE